MTELEKLHVIVEKLLKYNYYVLKIWTDREDGVVNPVSYNVVRDKALDEAVALAVIFDREHSSD